MDVNSAIVRIPSPTAASSSESVVSKPQEVTPPNAAGTKKNFASVLRTVQHGDEKGRLQRSDGADSRRVAKSGAETEHGKGSEDSAPESGKIERSGPDAEPDRLSQTQTDQSDDKEGRGQDEGALETDVPTELVRELDQLVPSQATPVTPSVVSTDDSGQGAIEAPLPHSSQNNGIGGASVAPVFLTAGLGESVAPTTDLTDQPPALPQGETVPIGTQSQSASAAQPMRETNEAPSDQPLDPMAESAIKVVDQEGEKQTEPPDQGSRAERQAVTVKRTTEGGEQVSQVAQELSRLDAAGPHVDRVVEGSVGQKPVEGTVQPHADPRPQFFSHDGEGSIGKPMPIAPHGLQVGTDSGQSSDLFWSNQGERQSSYHENPWMSHAPMVPSQSELPGDHSAQAMVAGSAASPPPRPMESHPASSAGAASSVAPAHAIEPFVPTMSRSVVFEIAEPDLGRINIRVAITNELVHAHLSSDRSDVGQFLLNGQDRLQSALQSNGLEMGQFRVDIDRQSAGRSFQQGPPQDQSRMWQQASDGVPRDAGYSERHYETNLSYVGRLNLVA